MSFKVYSEAFQDGKILEKYGAKSGNCIEGIPQLSFPLRWEGAPEGTKSFALVFIDYDNCIGEGIIWLHWLAANIPAYYTGLAEDASRTDQSFVQGRTTFGISVGHEDRLCWRYGGPAPEDRPHEYELTLYALSEAVDLADGYYYNEFRRAIEGKVLGVAELKGVYPNG